jgi:hypothetical protein
MTARRTETENRSGNGDERSDRNGMATEPQNETKNARFYRVFFEDRFNLRNG